MSHESKPRAPRPEPPALRAASSLWRTIGDRIAAVEARLSRQSNVLTFLLVRFLLMSGLVVAFVWVSLGLHP